MTLPDFGSLPFADPLTFTIFGRPARPTAQHQSPSHSRTRAGRKSCAAKAKGNCKMRIVQIFVP